MPSTAGDDTDLSTVADEKTMSQNEKDTNQSRDDSPRPRRLQDVDLEAQGVMSTPPFPPESHHTTRAYTLTHSPTVSP